VLASGDRAALGLLEAHRGVERCPALAGHQRRWTGRTGTCSATPRTPEVSAATTGRSVVDPRAGELPEQLEPPRHRQRSDHPLQQHRLGRLVEQRGSRHRPRPVEQQAHADLPGLLSALSTEERDMLYHLLARAVGVEPPHCDAADEPPP
jgi:hypothetical protein